MRDFKLAILELTVGFALSISMTACSSTQTLQSDSSSGPETSTKTVETIPAEKSAVPAIYEINFSTEVKNASLEGFSYREFWGRWTDGPQASINLKQDLPASFEVVIAGKAFGANANQDLTLAIGTQQKKFRLDSKQKEVKVEFAGVPANQRKITFMIPKPTSPLQAGQKDNRKLGIGLQTLKIV